MVEPKTEARKKSKRGARHAAPFTVQGQLIGKLGPTCFGQLLDRLNRTTRPAPRRRRPRRKVAA